MDEPFMNPEANSEAGADLTRAILARTSGSPCQRLREQACAYVDGELDEGRGGLMRAHMDHCAACASLVAALETSKMTLPALAELNPGPWFTQRVLRATAYAPRAASHDLRALWLKLLHRPRIALEAGFLGAAMSMLGLVIPLPALPSAARMPALVRPVVASAQRVTGSLIQAERRTAASLERALLPHDPLPSTPMTLWQRWTLRIRGWWQAMWKGREKSVRTGEPPSPPPRSSH